MRTGGKMQLYCISRAVNHERHSLSLIKHQARRIIHIRKFVHTKVEGVVSNGICSGEWEVLRTKDGLTYWYHPIRREAVFTDPAQPSEKPPSWDFARNTETSLGKNPKGTRTKSTTRSVKDNCKEFTFGAKIDVGPTIALKDVPPSVPTGKWHVAESQRMAEIEVAIGDRVRIKPNALLLSEGLEKESEISIADFPNFSTYACTAKEGRLLISAFTIGNELKLLEFDFAYGPILLAKSTIVAYDDSILFSLSRSAVPKQALSCAMHLLSIVVSRSPLRPCSFPKEAVLASGESKSKILLEVGGDFVGVALDTGRKYYMRREKLVACTARAFKRADNAVGDLIGLEGPGIAYLQSAGRSKAYFKSLRGMLNYLATMGRAHIEGLRSHHAIEPASEDVELTQVEVASTTQDPRRNTLAKKSVTPASYKKSADPVQLLETKANMIFGDLKETMGDIFGGISQAGDNAPLPPEKSPAVKSFENAAHETLGALTNLVTGAAEAVTKERRPTNPKTKGANKNVVATDVSHTGGHDVELSKVEQLTADAILNIQDYVKGKSIMKGEACDIKNKTERQN